MASSFITPLRHKNGKLFKPYIVQKTPHKYADPEGRFSVFLYSHKVYKNGEFFNRYRVVSFDGLPAFFKTKDEAKDYAFYRLGM